MNDFDIPRDGYIEMMQREAIVLVPYPDGKGWSQGIGCQFNYALNRPVQENDPPITVEEAIEWKKKAIAERLVNVRKALTVEVSTHDLYALVSIFYQFGSEALKRISALFNAGLPWAARLAFSEFPFGQNHIQTEGHSKRRIAEMCIAAFGYYDEQTQIPVYDTAPHGRKPDRFIDASTLSL